MSGFWYERRVLITGATGLVGSWLSAELGARGAHVTALVLDGEPLLDPSATAQRQNVNVVRGDLRRFGDCSRAINASEASVVFHLGAQTLVGAALRDPLETFESNISGTYNLLEAARRFPTLIEAVVVASSDKAYGDADGVAYTEDMPLAGRHPYDVSKSCTDLLATTYARTYKLPVAIARCGNIYGGGDFNWSRIVPGTIRSIVRGLAPVLRSDGRRIRDYIYVRDVVAAYLSLAEAIFKGAIGEAYNFSDESRVTVLEIVRAITTIMASDLEPTILNEASYEIPEQTLSSAKARRDLEWFPAWTLEGGLAETVNWYRSYFKRMCDVETSLVR